MKATVYDEGRSPNGPPLDEAGKPKPQKTKARARAGSAKWFVPAIEPSIDIHQLTKGDRHDQCP